MQLPIRRAAALALAGLALTAATASAAPGAKEFSLHRDAVPADIAAGPDGAVYAPDGSLGRLWRIAA